MTDPKEILAQMDAAALVANGKDPLEVSGLSTLTASADLGDVAVCLRRLVPLLPADDALERRVIRNKAIAVLKRIQVADAARLVDAAIVNGRALEPAPTAAPVNAEALLTAGRRVLDAPDVLAMVGNYVQRSGYAGDTRAPKLVYLAMTSRLLERPVNLFLAGPSAGGKNYTIRSVCPLFPPEAFYAVAGMSPLAVMYSDESFEHRTLIVNEASAFHEDGIGASLLRGLAWDGELKYDTVIDGESVKLHKAGPTGLITTGTRKLEPELATRLWTVPVPDDPKHTRAVLHATAGGVAGASVSEPARDPFIAAQGWLAAAGERTVVVPYAQELADLVPVHEVRMRRDFTQLLTLVQAHAFLHQRQRERDHHRRVLATVDDYAAVYDIVQPVFAASLSGGLTPEVRQVVMTVRELTAAVAGTTVTVSQVAEKLGLATNTCWRRIRTALEGRWLVNDEQRKHQAAKLRAGEPLPDEPGLPTPAEVLETWKRTPQALDTTADARFHDRFHAGGDAATRDSEVPLPPGPEGGEGGEDDDPGYPCDGAGLALEGGPGLLPEQWEDDELPF